MQLIKIKENEIYKNEKRDIYYKRKENLIFKSYWIDDWSKCTVINDIEELQSNVFSMNDPNFLIDCDAETQQVNLKIKQANMTICLDNLMVERLLEEIQEAKNAPF